MKLDLKYLKRVAGGLDLEKIDGYLDAVKEKNGKPKAAILADMTNCLVRYGAGFNDYIIFEFYNMNAKQRDTYMTRLRNKKFNLAMNSREHSDVFNLKNQFYAVFADLLGRAFLDLGKCTDEELGAFLLRRPEIIAKPNGGECGAGIEKLTKVDFAAMEDAVRYLRDPAKNFGVVEDVLYQHEKMSELYPHSVNCLRMCTLVVNGEAHYLYAVLKTGNHGKFVDNLENGGYACHVDLEKGVVIGPGHTSGREIREVHEATGVAFRGFEIPYAREAIELVKKAALYVPDVRYVGWDVAILPDGPVLIEGNDYTAYDFPQLPDDSVARFGLVGQLRKLLPDYKF